MINHSKFEAFYNIWTKPEYKNNILNHLNKINYIKFRNLLLISNRLEYFSYYCHLLLNEDEKENNLIPNYYNKNNYYELNLISPFYKYPSPIFTFKKSESSNSEYVYVDKCFTIFQTTMLNSEQFSNEIVRYKIDLNKHFLVFHESKLIFSEQIQVKSSNENKECEMLQIHFIINNGLYTNKIKDLMVIICDVIKVLVQNICLSRSGDLAYIFDFEISSSYKQIENVLFLNPIIFTEKKFPFLSELINPLKLFQFDMKVKLEFIHYRSSMYFFVYRAITQYISDFYISSGNILLSHKNFRKQQLFKNRFTASFEFIR